MQSRELFAPHAYTGLDKTLGSALVYELPPFSWTLLCTCIKTTDCSLNLLPNHVILLCCKWYIHLTIQRLEIFILEELSVSTDHHKRRKAILQMQRKQTSDIKMQPWLRWQTKYTHTQKNTIDNEKHKRVVRREGEGWGGGGGKTHLFDITFSAW